MPSICDLKKLRAGVRHGDAIQTLGAAREATNAVGIALTLLDRGEPVS
jgi:hypothetical protein